MKYAYPAVFTKEDEGGYSVFFPDLEGCYTCGETLPEAIEMAQDALSLFLYDAEEEKREIPAASELKSVEHDENAIVSLIVCDTLEYKKFFGDQAVRKTVTLPAWLNTMAEKADVSFSGVLQNALKQTLGLPTN